MLIPIKADKLFALDYKEEHYRDISFEKLQWWRDLEDRIIPCATILEATLVTLDAFDRAQKLTQSDDNRLHQGINAAPDVKFSYFRSRKALVEALRLSASGLRQRIHGALNLVGYLPFGEVDLLTGYSWKAHLS